MLKGIGKVSRQGRLETFECIENVEILDHLDMFVQIDSLRNLIDGWLDGEGIAPSEQGLNWVVDKLDDYFSDMTVPYLYPTPEGGVRAEWSLGKYEASLDIKLDNQTGYWHSLDMTNNTDAEKTLDLSKQEDWKWVLETLLKEIEKQA